MDLSTCKIKYKLPKKTKINSSNLILIFTFNTYRTTVPHCSKVSEQSLLNSVLTLSGTSNRQLVDKAGPHTSQEQHCPRKYGAAWLLASKEIVGWGTQNPWWTAEHCAWVTRGCHLSPWYLVGWGALGREGLVWGLTAGKWPMQDWSQPSSEALPICLGDFSPIQDHSDGSFGPASLSAQFHYLPSS